MTDKDLKRLVETALEWEPRVDTADVGVSVDQGVVTLRGNVASCIEKVRAERVTLGVYGVRAVANDLKVHLLVAAGRTDTEIAQAAVEALKSSTSVPADRLAVTVEDGWITLSGVLDWQFQKDAATRVLRDMVGVRGVLNHTTLQARGKAEVSHQLVGSIAGRCSTRRGRAAQRLPE